MASTKNAIKAAASLACSTACSCDLEDVYFLARVLIFFCELLSLMPFLSCWGFMFGVWAAPVAMAIPCSLRLLIKTHGRKKVSPLLSFGTRELM